FARLGLAATPNPIAPILAAAMRGLAGSGGEPAPAVREEVLREAAAQQKRLASHARGLDVIATLAPLLGLLGTVLGMIDAFRELEAAGGRADPALLAGGIWEALLTTAAGLAIAIPAAAAVHWIESVVEGIRHDAEDAVTRLFTGALPATPITAPPRVQADAP
ncbi:MotA/TolQ/ExbB proton channel family protein, partial [Thiococcus pfennigii]|uniref:MotA/TolQ/ExbB proton channel family protein n=1 Tax=Thiococcus pfennigii TaxID=1057 RepID=UPI0019088664